MIHPHHPWALWSDTTHHPWPTAPPTLLCPTLLPTLHALCPPSPKTLMPSVQALKVVYCDSPQLRAGHSMHSRLGPALTRTLPMPHLLSAARLLALAPSMHVP
jgi:hypothetical protein